MVEWLHQRLVFLGELLHEHLWEEEEMYNVLLMAKVCMGDLFFTITMLFLLRVQLVSLNEPTWKAILYGISIAVKAVMRGQVRDVLNKELHARHLCVDQSPPDLCFLEPVLTFYRSHAFLERLTWGVFSETPSKPTLPAFFNVADKEDMEPSSTVMIGRSSFIV